MKATSEIVSVAIHPGIGVARVGALKWAGCGGGMPRRPHIA